MMQKQNSIIWRTWEWLDNRYDLTTLMGALLHVEIPRSVRTYYLGGITLFFFTVQVITGILLTIYYQPTPGAAYDSILFIMTEVRFGWLIRSIHAWSANLMVIFCVLHLLRVFFQGAFKSPREVTWVVGVFLLAVTLGFGFTGYLLPWDQRAFWATTVGTEIAGAVPFIGEQLLVFMRGNPQVTAHTLSRFYGVHVLVMPVSLGFLLVVHLVLIHQQGIADPDADPAAEAEQSPENKPKKKRLLPFFPNYVLDEVIAWYAMLAILVILASIFPAGLEEPADPFITPPHAKPEWYFLFLYQWLKLVPRIVGVLAPMVGFILLVVLPFLDRNPYPQPHKRPISAIMGGLTLIIVIVLTIWGWQS